MSAQINHQLYVSVLDINRDFTGHYTVDDFQMLGGFKCIGLWVGHL